MYSFARGQSAVAAPLRQDGAGRTKRALSYRADVDGLRAIAVLVVVGYHAFPHLVPGGFVGVDVFFVISGFLITGFIFDELERGCFSLAGFYARRIRRIFPALIVVLLATLALGWLFLLPDELVSLAVTETGAAAFVANLVFFQQAGYFDAAAVYKPLLHLWSLGIEEQFYIVWPPLLLILSRRGQNLFGWMLGLAGLSFAVGVATLRTDPVAAFYLPHTRAWELLLGGLLAGVAANRVPQWLSQMHARTEAWLPAWIAMRAGREDRSVAVNTRALLGITLIACGVIFLHQNSTFPGWRALLPTVGTLLLISAAGSGFNRSVLSHPAFVFVGLISYPLYLWHWPLLSFARIVQPSPLSRTSIVLCVGLSVALAWLTYALIEKPIRFGARRRGKIISLCAVAAALGCAGLVIVRADGFESRIPNLNAENLREVSHLYVGAAEAWRMDVCLLKTDSPLPQFADRCVDKERRPLVGLWGDSVGAALYPGLRHAQASHDFGIGQYTLGQCPPILAYDTDIHPFCKQGNEIALSALSRERPDVVLLDSFWAYPGVQFDDIGQTIARLRSIGLGKIVVVGPPVTWTGSGLPQLILRRFARPDSLGPERTWSYVAGALRYFDMTLQKQAAGWGVAYISVWDLMCNAEGCLMRVGPQGRDVATLDTFHPSLAGSQFLADAITPRLLRAAAGNSHPAE